MTDAEVKMIKTEDFYEYSIAWLEKADAVLVVPGWEDSVGTKKELARAKELSIPIYYSMAELLVVEMKK
jgi:predicted Rossmann-fold nucleotide-binding protein